LKSQYFGKFTSRPTNSSHHIGQETYLYNGSTSEEQTLYKTEDAIAIKPYFYAKAKIYLLKTKNFVALSPQANYINNVIFLLGHYISPLTRLLLEMLTVTETYRNVLSVANQCNRKLKYNIVFDTIRLCNESRTQGLMIVKTLPPLSQSSRYCCPSSISSLGIILLAEGGASVTSARLSILATIRRGGSGVNSVV
jgi:hypothetical protein